MEKELCVPCSIKLANAYEVKMTTYLRDKITCAECGRRRYGNKYTISRKNKRGKKEKP